MKRTFFASAMLIAGAILTIGNAEDIGLAMMGLAFVVALAAPAKKFFTWLYFSKGTESKSNLEK